MVISSKENVVRQTESITASEFSTQQSHQINKASRIQVQETILSIDKSWPTLDEKTYMEKEATISQIEQYVKNNLFHRLKFISAPEMMDFLRHPRLLTQVACSHFNVPKDYQHWFWAQYGK